LLPLNSHFLACEPIDYSLDSSSVLEDERMLNRTANQTTTYLRFNFVVSFTLRICGFPRSQLCEFRSSTPQMEEADEGVRQGNELAQSCIKRYDRLPKNGKPQPDGKQWTVLAGMIIKRPSATGIATARKKGCPPFS